MSFQGPVVSVLSRSGSESCLSFSHLQNKHPILVLIILMQRCVLEMCTVVSDVARRERASESICGLMQCWKCQLSHSTLLVEQTITATATC